MADEINSTEELNEQTQTLVEVGEDLAELLSNSVNMAEKFYEIFFDSNPHYVELQMYDKDGNLITHMVPNRAMDKSIATSGEGTPEGNVEGYLGNLYVDVITRDLYIKKVDGGTTGWACITPKAISIWTEEFTFDPEDATYVKISKYIRYPEHLMVFANGEILIPPSNVISDDENTNHEYDYSLGADRQTLYIYKELPNNSTIFIRYLDGLDGLKGDTALRVSVKETITLNPDEQADVIEELVDIDGEGNGQDIQLTFKIPRGVTGNSGVYIGDTEPEDESQNVWIDTSADGTSEADFAGMRIWDSGICSSLKGYDKVYELQHSLFNGNQVDVVGNIDITNIGIATGFVDNSNGNYVGIPYKIGQLAGHSWLIKGECTLGHPHSGETPIVLFSGGERMYGAIYATTNAFCFAARTGNELDNDSLHDNQGVKIQIYHEFSSEPETFYYQLYYQKDIHLYTFTIFDEHNKEIGHKNWNAPLQITKNGEIIDMHDQDLIGFYIYPDNEIIIGSFIESGVNSRHNNDIHYLQYFQLQVENEDGHLATVFTTNVTGTDTLDYNNITSTITYNKTITGAKVADMTYRAMLEEYYKYTGKGNYYLIDVRSQTFTLPHPDLYGLIGSHCTIIDSYVNGTSGYRIWSDGYCEQWGISNAVSGEQTIALLKIMANTYYQVLLTPLGTNTTQSWSNTAKSISTISVSNSIAQSLHWKVSGYLAEGEY